MPDIKTRDVVKSTVKTIDKSATASQRMKDAYIRTKRKAESRVYSAEDSLSEYAADRVSVGTETVLHKTGHQLHRQEQKAVSSAKENISNVKSHFQRERMTYPLKKQYNSHSPRSTKGAVKTIEPSKKGVKQVAKGTSKAARCSVKTAEKTTIKTSQQAVRATQRTVQAAARASHRAAQAARVAAKATVTALKAAVRTTISAVKAIIAAAGLPFCSHRYLLDRPDGWLLLWNILFRRGHRPTSQTAAIRRLVHTCIFTVESLLFVCYN